MEFRVQARIDDMGTRVSQVEDFTHTIEEVSRPKKKTKHQHIFYNDANVLISGMGGVGAQLAKCLVHAGVKSLTLQDDGEVDWCDLSSNPFVTEADLGKSRASVCAGKLHIFNGEVEINVLTSKLQAPHQLSNFQVVVLTDTSLSEAVAISDYCHNHSPPIYFIRAEVRGLFGRVFCDFGPQFNCNIVESKGLCHHGRSIVTIKDDHPIILGRLDFEYTQMLIKNNQACSGECDTCKVDGSGGVERQTKLLHFKPLKDALRVEEPVDLIVGANTNSVEKRPLVLHIAFKALDDFIQQRGCLPAPDSWYDNNQLCSIASKMMKEVPSIDVAKECPLLQQFASGSRAVIGPMASIFGGIVGQEVVKALSKVSHPIFQFFYFDSLESLPSIQSGGDSSPRCSRYDAQTLLFGRDVQKKLEEAKLLVVGDGILGCEVMRNLALMGVCSRSDAKMAVAHRIPARSRISYIGRQTIFEDCYEEQDLPVLPITSAISINDNLNIHVLKESWEQGLEHVYEDAFWESLDTIIDATNDIRSMRRVSDLSSHFLKPLLLPLISGAQCHSLVQLRRDKSWEKVLLEFPFVWRIPGNEQYLGLSRSEFEGLFVKTPGNVNMFLLDHDSFVYTVRLSGDAQSRDILHRIIEFLDVEWCETFEDCVDWARMRFETYFVHNIHLYLKSCDRGRKPTGQLASCSRLPKPLVFSATDVEHQKFVKAASILRANTYGIKLPSSVDWVSEVERVQHLSCKQVMKVPITEPVDSLVGRVEELVQKLPTGFQMNPMPFDVENDCQMDFVTSMFNLFLTSEWPFKLFEDRAKEVLRRCYPQPLATSYTVAAGLTCLNLYKLIGGGTVKDKRSLQNVESNLESCRFFKSPATPTRA